jgi:hypothetical protein
VSERRGVTQRVSLSIDPCPRRLTASVLWGGVRGTQALRNEPRNSTGYLTSEPDVSDAESLDPTLSLNL